MGSLKGRVFDKRQSNIWLVGRRVQTKVGLVHTHFVRRHFARTFVVFVQTVEAGLDSVSSAGPKGDGSFGEGVGTTTPQGADRHRHADQTIHSSHSFCRRDPDADAVFVRGGCLSGVGEQQWCGPTLLWFWGDSGAYLHSSLQFFLTTG